MSSKFMRTVIVDGSGFISSARINLNTGEIKPYQYKKPLPVLKPVAKAGYCVYNDSTIPHWQIVPYGLSHEVKATPKRSRKTRENTSSIYLKEFDNKEDAIAYLPTLDAILDGTGRLETGKKKPISQSVLFHLLQNLESVDSASIQSFTGFSDRYCRTLAGMLRVAINAFERELEN